MSKKVSLGAAVSIAALSAAVAVSLTYVYAMGRFNEKLADVNERQVMYSKLSEIDRSIRQEYDGEWTETELQDSLCMGYLAGLGDPNAEYLSAEEYKAALDASSSPESGVGVATVQDADGNMEIVRVSAGSSGKEAGLQVGDVILALDGKEVVRMGYGTAEKLLDGTAGTKVELTVLRPGQDGEAPEVLSFEISREEYAEPDVESAVLGETVGYILIRSFTAETAALLQEAYTAFAEQGVSGIVLDLRDNAGGDVEAMASAVDLIVPAGTTVQYKAKDGTIEAVGASDAAAWALPLAVVMNRGTSGAAELFAANIRTYCGGSLIGEKSAGEAPVKKTVMLSDGSAITFTSGQYLTPEGEAIAGAGLIPDMQSALPEEDRAAYLRGTLDPETDVQIQAAVAALSAQGADVGTFPIP